MRHFVYFSNSAATSGKALSGGDLMKAGRMDIAIHSLISAFFLSHDFRKDVILHLVFYGMPDPPKHIEIDSSKGLDLSKRDVAGFLKKVLYKAKDGEKNEVMPGVYIEKKSFLNVVQELIDMGKEIFVLDKGGEQLRNAEIGDNSVFVLGDQDGFPLKEFKRLKKSCNLVNIGPKVYFASQVVAIVNNELDLRGL
jgi:tRNA (pseudouridine54-N1)-methyltransferase